MSPELNQILTWGVLGLIAGAVIFFTGWRLAARAAASIRIETGHGRIRIGDTLTGRVVIEPKRNDETGRVELTLAIDREQGRNEEKNPTAHVFHREVLAERLSLKPHSPVTLPFSVDLPAERGDFLSIDIGGWMADNLGGAGEAFARMLEAGARQHRHWIAITVTVERKGPDLIATDVIDLDLD